MKTEALEEFVTNVSEGYFVSLQEVKEAAERVLKRIADYESLPDWQKLRDIADELGGEFVENYSGRGMYGRKCVGITTSDEWAVVAAARNVGITCERTDNMGLDIIVYWPDVQKE